ncbi:unnamed protein product [Echinostoma caproni]|uniref:Reverse transcriptase domain-containing protein n=1 Tax=Echinostoma caproni TaxID=27848 RepID=A0A183B8T2_9TREM|nr:unnamed protein product [Echinostoma caproni]
MQSKAHSWIAVNSVVNADGFSAATSKEKAEVLKSFFKKFHISDLGNPLPDPMGRLPEQQMAPFVLEAKEVEAALKQLEQNKAAGRDGLHPVTMRPIADIIAGAHSDFQPIPCLRNAAGRLNHGRSGANQQKWVNGGCIELSSSEPAFRSPENLRASP